MQVCVFPKIKNDKRKGEIKSKIGMKKQAKEKYVHNIQWLSSSKVSFQSLAIHQIGVRFPF
jgi:hypothetical protein